MAITNKGSLQSAVESWLERSFDDALFVEFAANVTDKLERGVMSPDGRAWACPPLRCRAMLVSDEMDSATGEVTDWLAFERVWIDSQSEGRDLHYVTPQKFASDPRAAQTGTPSIYTIDGNQFRAAPTTPTILQVTYYQTLGALSDDADTNTVLGAHPRVYLYGCIAEACGWIGDFARQDREFMNFAAAVKALNVERVQSNTSGSVLVMRPGAVA